MSREAQAEEYLLQLGYIILARRYQTPFAEVDLIAAKNSSTIDVFEVKGPSRGLDFPSIGQAQMARLGRACVHLGHQYLRQVRLHLLLVGPTKVEVIWDLWLQA